MIIKILFATSLIALSTGAALDNHVDEAFPQEIPTAFVPGQGLDLGPGIPPMENVSAIQSRPDGGMWAVLTDTAGPSETQHAALVRYANGTFSAPPAPNGRDFMNPSTSAAQEWFKRTRTAISTANGQIRVEGGSIFAYKEGNAQKIYETKDEVLSITANKVGAVALGTESGLFLRKGGAATFLSVYPADKNYSWAPRNVAAVAYDRKGRLWFGSDEGVGVLEGDAWTLYTGNEGLPCKQFTCATAGEEGVIWFGTERGAIRFDGKQWSYRASLRWLPDDYVNAIAVQDNGTAWIATRKGIARIERKMMSLAEKAAHFERIIDARHRRMDYVVRCYFKAPGALDTAYLRHTDNDGLYTALYGASQCFRYGATKDPEAKERARRCFRGLKMLFDVTGIPGFPARSVLPVEEGGENPNDAFGAAANAAMQKSDPLWKSILPRWPKSADGKYYWKCDTSSDEICGHYFFYGLYYDLIAETEAEKAEVRSVVQALTDHIVDNGFQLIDHDGKPTRWGRWSTDYINTLQGWEDRGIQSLEMLSFLNVAQHVTGDPKYRETAKMLRAKHAYHVNALWGKAVWPPDCVVPWDGNLAFTSLYGLLKHETDPEVLKYYRIALDNTWLFVSRQNDPFFNTVYVSMMPDTKRPVYDDVVPDMVMPRAGALKTLRDTPLLLIGWDMKNSHRLDVEINLETRWRKHYGWQHNGQALPVQERSHVRINSDHFDLDGRGGGTFEYEGSFYLLPYYMGLYHGLLK